MTPKERQLAAIRGELTDRISVDAIYIHNQPEIAKLIGASSNQVLDEDVPAQNTIALFKSACAFRRNGYTL